MEKKCSHPEKVVNLKQLPPIDPFKIMNYSTEGRRNKSSSRAAPKVVKPSPDCGMKLVGSEEEPKNSNFASITQSSWLREAAEASSISSNKKVETKTPENTTSQTLSADEGLKKGSARANLYEICAANHWNPPRFECCKEEGPSHKRIFTFKVVIEIQTASKTIIECFGAPRQNKKTAADQAAEGALWYLKHQVMLSRLGCQCAEDRDPLEDIPFPVKSCVLFPVGVLASHKEVLLVKHLLWNGVIPEDTASKSHTIIFFFFARLDVSNFMNWRMAIFSSRRVRMFWRNPLKLSYGAKRYYIELLSKQEHCVWCNNCPWLLEHMWICNTASRVATHNFSC